MPPTASRSSSWYRPNCTGKSVTAPYLSKAEGLLDQVPPSSSFVVCAPAGLGTTRSAGTRGAARPPRTTTGPAGPSASARLQAAHVLEEGRAVFHDGVVAPTLAAPATLATIATPVVAPIALP